MSFKYLAPILALLIPATSATAQTRMVRLDEVARTTTVRNFSTTATVDIGGFFLCRAPTTYRQIDNLPIVQGDTLLSPGEEVTIEYSFIQTAGGIGLYANDNNFNAAVNMLDYVQYGGVAGFRENVAVQAGLWTASTFASGNTGPYLYCGDGMTENGADFWASEIGSIFCTSNPNSSGSIATLTASGSPTAMPLDVEFKISNLPLAANFGLLFFSPQQATPSVFGNGVLCVGSPIVRVSPTVLAADMVTFPLDGSASYASSIVPGVTQTFQFWFRDTAGGGAGFNTSDGLAINFQ